MPLQQLTERVYNLPGANNIGIIVTGGGDALVIDTGIDKEMGRAIRKALDEVKLQLRAILNTHHHADHIGGNDYLVRNVAGVTVYAPPIEAALIEHPILEPAYLHMGAQPIKALQTKWLMAKGTAVHHILQHDTLEIGAAQLEIVPLPGHSINQVGVAVDGVCFVADGFFGPAVLQKHGIPYAHDVAAQLASLQRLAGRTEQVFVPGHGDVTPGAALEEALAANRRAIEQASLVVQAALAEPGELATVARRVQQALGLTLAGIPQYAIFVSAVAAHLSYLEVQGLAAVVLDDQQLIWRNA